MYKISVGYFIPPACTFFCSNSSCNFAKTNNDRKESKLYLLELIGNGWQQSNGSHHSSLKTIATKEERNSSIISLNNSLVVWRIRNFILL